MLRRLGACADQVAKFERLFGERVAVTEALCVRHAEDFEWNWAARNLLPAPALAEYERDRAAIRARYDRVCATALVEYQRAVAPAWEAHDRACATAKAEYDCACAMALERKRRVIAPAKARYRRGLASIFGALAELC
jgi:hypothetical protein